MSNNRLGKKNKKKINVNPEKDNKTINNSSTKLELIQGNIPLITIKLLEQINNNLVTLTTIIKNQILENNK